MALIQPSEQSKLYRAERLAVWRHLKARRDDYAASARQHGASEQTAEAAAGRQVRGEVRTFVADLLLHLPKPQVDAFARAAPREWGVRTELLLDVDPLVPSYLGQEGPASPPGALSPRMSARKGPTLARAERDEDWSAWLRAELPRDRGEASVAEHVFGGTKRLLQTQAVEDGADEVTELEAAVAKYGPGDSIGRWGPVQAHTGRTVGEPCTGVFDACDDYDLDAWLAEAKKWTAYAKKFRDDNVTYQWGPAPSGWPRTARMGEHAYQRAREIIAGDLGYLDSAKVLTLQGAQRYAKVALELFMRAIEKEVGTTVDVPDNLQQDTVTDHADRPKITPLPKLPELPSLRDALNVAAGFFSVGAVVVGGIWVLRRRTGT